MKRIVLSCFSINNIFTMNNISNILTNNNKNNQIIAEKEKKLINTNTINFKNNVLLKNLKIISHNSNNIFDGFENILKSVIDDINTSLKFSFKEDEYKNLDILSNYLFSDYISNGSHGNIIKCNKIIYNDNFTKINNDNIVVKISENPILNVEFIKICNNYNNIAKIYDSFNLKIKDRDINFLFMEYCNNGNLKYFIDNDLKKYKFSHHRMILAHFSLQIINALKYLHTHKIIHKDIKPENIVLDSDFNIKLVDFEHHFEYDNIQENILDCAEYGYNSPEILREDIIESKDFNKVDVFSLGMLLYYIYYRVLPYTFDYTKNNCNFLNDLLDYFNQEKQLDFPDNELVDDDVKDLITKCLKSNINNRISIFDIKNTEFYMYWSKELENKQTNEIFVEESDIFEYIDDFK